MEERGAAKPGLLVLTTGLSKAFRRLDKYSAMLQELERHMESGHPDRGNTQRSVAVYKDIAVGDIYIIIEIVFNYRLTYHLYYSRCVQLLDGKKS